MPRRLVKIHIPRRGFSRGERKLEVVTQGFVGEACQEATRTLLAGLGGAQEETLTEEYHVEPDRHGHVDLDNPSDN